MREITVVVTKRDFLLEDVVDGEITEYEEYSNSYSYDRDEYPGPEGWHEWIADLVKVFKSEGLEFQGQRSATLPDGSYCINHAAGRQREVSAYFANNPEIPEVGEPNFQSALQEYVDQQAVMLRVG